jgi:hypothetical protein
MVPPVKFKLSKTTAAVRKRIQRLPKLVEEFVDANLKMDAENMVANFKEGIEKNNFRLIPLKPATVRKKQRQGLPKPKTPLYGKGRGHKNSLINALGIRKVKNGYRVYRRRAKHYKANMSLRKLLAIHEQGALVENGFGRGILIRIPARPVVRKAFERTLNQRAKREPTSKVRAAIRRLIRTGREDGFRLTRKVRDE